MNNRIYRKIIIPLVLLLVMTLPALATSTSPGAPINGENVSRTTSGFFFNFVPPYKGCIQYSRNSEEIEQTGPAVFSQTYYLPDLSMYGVNYFCFEDGSSASSIATNIETLYVDTSTHYLYYDTGYGNVGESYWLAGYPDSYTFTYYYVEGIWDSSVNN